MRRHALLIAFVFILRGVSCTPFREDEVTCEEAMKHVADCCPGFSPAAVVCSYDDIVDGCSGEVVGHRAPTFTPADSYCMLGKSCADLVSSGLCETVPNTPRDRANGVRVCE